LIFESLVRQRIDPKFGPHYRPALVESLPAEAGVRRPFALRRDVYWSDGERFTAADVRHTAQLLSRPGLPGGAEWRDLLDPPRLENDPFGLEIVYRRGLLDPWSALTFKVLPQRARGKPLTRADDPEFARQPLGTGPYQWQGRGAGDGRVYIVLRANPYYPPRKPEESWPIREIRFFAWQGDGELKPPLPHLVLDASPAQAAALKKHSYGAPRRLPMQRVWFLAVNHRRAALANVHLRLALSEAVDRKSLLARHLGGEPTMSSAVSANGPFPRGSWAECPAPRVPVELYRPEDARASARKAAKEFSKVEWTLKYPDGDPRLHAAFAELAEHVKKTLAAADVELVLRPVPLSPRKLQEAVRDRDFDLAYLHVDQADNPAELWPLFDPDPKAVEPGGSSFLGFHDAALQSLLRSASHHRHFPLVRGLMHDVHARLTETMPLIPLWQLPYTVAIHEKLRVPEIDPHAVFANVLEWKLSP
jgi:peptide/nickel transport system substrate-binding protein